MMHIVKKVLTIALFVAAIVTAMSRFVAVQDWTVGVLWTHVGSENVALIQLAVCAVFLVISSIYLAATWYTFYELLDDVLGPRNSF